MAGKDAPTSSKLNDQAIADWFGVAKSAVGKWRIGQAQAAAPDAPRKTPAFVRVAADLGVNLTAEDQAAALVPRTVVEAFGKAVGYLDAAGELIPEIQDKPKGRWSPVAPTIDPVPDENGKPRKRWYKPHIADEYGIPEGTLSAWMNRDPEFPTPHQDELSRTYLYTEQLEAYDKVLARREEEKAAGPAPNGHDEQGRPWRFIAKRTDRADGVDTATGRAYQLLPADSYYAKKAVAAAKAGKKSRQS
ncbi:hypothetical protein QMK19_22930 [Streptomyces sp. H10-C2]|nr:hypothetical protein [Streptomyces sp. PH10-H1]MDJ0372438.1 hypothetical protein [Streptomyces sp. H10-C2]